MATCPDILQRTGRKSGENQQQGRKRVCTKPGKQARPIAEADLDRTRVGLSPERVRVVRSFSSYLHQMGPTRTKWKCYGALWQHVDWSRGEFS